MLASYIYAQNLIAEAKSYLLTPKKGQGLVEYVLILVLIALVAIAAMGFLGTSVNKSFTNAENALDSGANVAP